MTKIKIIKATDIPPSKEGYIKKYEELLTKYHKLAKGEALKVQLDTKGARSSITRLFQRHGIKTKPTQRKINNTLYLFITKRTKYSPKNT